MRKLILVSLGLLLGAQAFAFTDTLTLDETKNLITTVQTQNSWQERSRALAKYKSFLNNRLNSFEIPEDALTVDDELAMEFASLNEFESYVDNIELKNLNPKSCAALLAHIESASGAQQNQLEKSKLSSAAVLAQDIIKSLCH